MRLAVGETFGHYRILAFLGAGGMGEVYRATDTRLGREIALEILPSDVGADHERLARFQQEAKAAAALNHPNIVTLFSAEETAGVHFLTMELVDGRSLHELDSAGRISSRSRHRSGHVAGRGHRGGTRERSGASRSETRQCHVDR